eukprot:CAMPEP_0196822600 /NCGR_PEP_ID=MMETSP1362-20130617/84027_1 /TAXON_ID=163516 /ORGANISM="Leptocylindrus danicus, Strain CCMP1856" /LENGTH=250 /DNA_ID=CAMNT_0042202197 /DNA_START=46 /DNA_END=798 /DNA_ORIENTATION=-
MSQLLWLIKNILVAFSIASSAVAVIGEEDDQFCECSPSKFEWKMDFSGTCPPNLISTGPLTGIRDVWCIISSGGINDNLVPVKVVNVHIQEMNRNLEIIGGLSTDVNLQDGDSFVYESIASDPTETDVVGAMQMELVGENSEGITVYNESILRYTNKCTIYPFIEGDILGWSIFTNLGPAQKEACPLVSDAPSTMPSKAPAETPSVTTMPPKYSTPSSNIVAAKTSKGKKSGGGKKASKAKGNKSKKTKQ